jgi:hypothetical protein
VSRIRHLAVAAALACSLSAGAAATPPLTAPPTQAATPTGTPSSTWSAPQTVFSDVWVRQPVPFVDSAGTLHVIFTTGEKRGVPSALRYTRRTNGQWSEPVTLMTDTVAAPSAAIDRNGYVHLVYGGRMGRLDYRQVHLSRVEDPGAWSRARALSGDQTFHSTIYAADDGQLHVLYASRKHNVYHRSSSDGGLTWSDLHKVSSLDPTVQAADGPRVVRDRQGRLHAVWTQFLLPSGWPPAGGFYSRSFNNGRLWTAPRQFAEEKYGQPNMALRGNELHLVWNSLAGIGKRLHSWSSDGGETWTEPAVITRSISGGWTGPPGLVVDSAGTLHMITSVSGERGAQDIERIFYMRWDGSSWSKPELVSGGLGATSSVEGPTLAISDGNRLHVLCEADLSRLWYAEKMVDAPPLAPVAVPTLATGVTARFWQASLPLRILLVFGALLAVQAAASALWRLARGGAR